MNPLQQKLFELLKTIPKGKVTSYLWLGQALNCHPRLVGKMLHKNHNPLLYPCHRVVKSDGCLASGYAFGGASRQKELLIQEGVQFSKNGKISPINFFKILDKR